MSSLQSTIHVTIGFLLIFGETNFVEVPNIHEIHTICSPQQKGALRYIVLFYTLFGYYNHCVFSLQKASTTSASNMYTVCPTIHYRANYQDVPFVVGTVSMVLA